MVMPTGASVSENSSGSLSTSSTRTAYVYTSFKKATVGGGDPIRPGEVTLSHGGVLFLDELPEFRRAALEGLRPTMESGVAVVVRARERVIMPARPLVVAAMNPSTPDPAKIYIDAFEAIATARESPPTTP